MSDENPLLDSINKIKKILDDLNDTNKEAILNLIDEHFQNNNSSNPSKENLNKIWLAGFFFALIFLPLFAFFLAKENIAIPINSNNGLDFKHLLAIIAFILAIASYLAAMIREIAKNTNSSLKKDKYIKNKKRMYFITIGEISLFLLGALIITKLFMGTIYFFSFDILSDIYIISYLLTIIMYLAVLHLIVWITEKPWKIPIE